MESLRPALILAVLVTALLAPSGAFAATTVKPPMGWKVVVAPTDSGCGKYLLRTWPRVPEEESQVWMFNGVKTSKPTQFRISAPFNDTMTHSDGTVIDRAPKGTHQYSMGFFGDLHGCEDVDRRISERIKRYTTYVEVWTGAERLIKGKVTLKCKGAGACPRKPLGVLGATVSAGGAKATTSYGGDYLLAVRKGVHTVRAVTGDLRVKKDKKKVRMVKPGTRKANFNACGFKGSPRASAAKVAGGEWKGSSCDNLVRMRWRDSDTAGQGLSVIEWSAAPTCSNGNDRYVGPYKSLAKEVVFEPANYQVTPDRVTFKSSKAIALPPQGFLGADGKGLFEGALQAGDCRYSTSVTLKHQK